MFVKTHTGRVLNLNLAFEVKTAQQHNFQTGQWEWHILADFPGRQVGTEEVKLATFQGDGDAAEKLADITLKRILSAMTAGQGLFEL